MSIRSITRKHLVLSTAQRDNIAGWLFVSPAALGLLMWVVAPMIASLVLSFTEYSVLSPAKYIGTANWVEMFTDDVRFIDSIKVTFKFVGIQLPAGLAIALAIALLLNSTAFGMTFFRTMFYMPAMVPAVANALLWAWLLSFDHGLVNEVVKRLGFRSVNWLGSPTTALPTLAAMSWWGVGPTAVIFLAALLSVPSSLYEAAEIDGAGALRRFWSITLPSISPTILFNVVMGLIHSFQYFTNAYLLTNGGPMRSTLFYNLYLYQIAFRYLKMGYACSLAWFLFAIILVLTLLVLRSSALWVYYETEVR
jgi:multiple sugar transport system permease protein